MNVIDLHLLADILTSTPEAQSLDAAGINPYLLNHIFPLLRQEEAPDLQDIDFGQFEDGDVPRFAGYIQELDHMAYKLTELNKHFCGQPATCRDTRSFL